MRSAMHQAEECTLTELLRFPIPEHRAIPGGKQALHRDLRSKMVRTAVGIVEVWRP